MTNQKRIIVLFTPTTKGLNAAYHAFSLAERIKARIFILYFKTSAHSQQEMTWLEEALSTITKNARQEGLSVTYHVVQGGFEQEVASLIEEENIDLVVYDADDSNGPQGPAIGRIRSQVSSQFIEVKGKYDFSCLQGKDE